MICVKDERNWQRIKKGKRKAGIKNGKRWEALSCRVLEATSVGILVSDFIGPSFPLGFVHSSVLPLAAVAVLCVVICFSLSLFLFLMPRRTRKLSQAHSYWFWYVDGESTADKHVLCS
ncbi:hypothetical protein VNO78_34289 [Psophocarpus tetragonolobus]|uniref:Uncharacterized protein n=1 Tax=Psophocarpus tetragonolobus TaxID=3891 RepID=A0AAN9NUW1_PSOTE